MKINGKTFRSIKAYPEGGIEIIDQRVLPFEVSFIQLKDCESLISAIAEMAIRGAPLIGVAAAYGIWLACKEAEQKNKSDKWLYEISEKLKAARPTAINLKWAVEKMGACIASEQNSAARTQLAFSEAKKIEEADVLACKKIGEFGLELIHDIWKKKNEPVQILTHCNAGWLATVDWGTATAPIYLAAQAGIPVHVWVDETRPRNQGLITAWEFRENQIPHTLIADNTGGLLMQQKKVDLVITGADRVTVTGDVANKIGTYLKALAAYENGIPFYVAFPASTFDFLLRNGIEIPIEERPGEELRYINTMTGIHNLIPETSPVFNPGFDITPNKLVSGLITEKGICKAEESEICRLFPEWAPWA